MEHAPAPTTEQVLTAHIARTRRGFILVAAIIATLVAAFGVGTYLIYKNATAPARITAVFNHEFEKRDAAAKAANAEGLKHFCLLLNQLEQTPAVIALKNDAACPGTPNGIAAAKAAQQKSGGGSTTNNTTTNNTTTNNNHTTAPSPAAKSPSPKPPTTKPVPSPTCLLHNPLTGKCTPL